MKKDNSSEITQERLKKVLDYNQNTGVFTWKINTGPRSVVANRAGSYDAKGYITISIDAKVRKAHRLAWLYIHGDFPQGIRPFIDHINGKPDDNRIVNLRVSSGVENSRNRFKTSTNETGFKGVSWDKNNRGNKKFKAQIRNPITGRNENLGRYVTPKEASVVYETKSKEYYGDFYREPEKQNDLHSTIDTPVPTGKEQGD